MVDSVSLVVVLLLLSYACADAPTSNNTVFVNPSNTTTGPIVWELGTTQVIQWNTTASPLSLDLYQYISETKNYESAYIFCMILPCARVYCFTIYSFSLRVTIISHGGIRINMVL